MDLIDGFHRMRWVRILQLPGFTDDQATAFPSDGPPRNVIQRMGVSGLVLLEMTILSSVR